MQVLQRRTLREKCAYSELFWSTFFCIQTEYGENLSVFSPNAENTDQKSTEYGHFSRSGN